MLVNIKNNIDVIMEQVAKASLSAGRNEKEITIIAVTKGKDVRYIKEALAGGIVDFGENYLQDAIPKIKVLENQNMKWHFIGAVQRNKLRKISDSFHFIHSIDKFSIIKQLTLLKNEGVQIPPFLIEVQYRKSENTNGVLPEKLEFFIENIISSGLSVHGLMTMAPITSSPIEARSVFKSLKLLAEKIESQKYPGVKMNHLSMGMTNDFTIAIQEGATMIRIGRGIFGER